ncbi:MAG: outer membrane protein assembly factor BamD [Nitrospirota bacterium]
MKSALFIVMLLITFVFSGCAGDKAAELFETAKFEEVQNNKEHAKQLYEEIIKKYPDSEYAKQAEKRLAELR